MISGFLIMGGLGVVIGVVLAVASKVFYVYVDPKIEAVEDALPGANCGGCGLPGCSSNAAAIVEGKSSPSSCVAGGPDVAAEIAKIMGVTITLREPEIAAPGCRYGYQDADIKYLYQGIQDCRAAMLLDGGSKICTIGCLGLGTCVRACPFGALSMGPDNLPVVDTDLCTGCGTCERVCPKHIITLTSTSDRIINEYVDDECTAPCQRSCPTGINIPAFIREIRNHNYEAYFWHGPAVSHVTIGAFSANAIRVQDLGRGRRRIDILDPRIKALQKEFPRMAINGVGVNDIVRSPDGKIIRIPQKTVLVRIPRPDRSR